MNRDHARREDFQKSGTRGHFSPSASKKECLLTEDLVTLMKENFEKLDRYEDLVVPRAQLIESLKKDVRIKKFMNKGVVYLSRIGKEIVLRKVLQQIEHEEFIKADTLDAGDSNFVSSKKYISWKNFMDYFVNYAKNQALPDFDPEFRKDEGDDQDVIEMSKNMKERLKAIFNEMKDEDGYVKSFDYLNRLKGERLFIELLDTQIRTKAKYGEIPAEKLRDTLSRIENTIDDYTDWDEFIQYFTKRGVPVSHDYSRKLPQLSHVVAPMVNKTNQIQSDQISPEFNLTTDQTANALGDYLGARPEMNIASLNIGNGKQQNQNSPYAKEIGGYSNLSSTDPLSMNLPPRKNIGGGVNELPNTYPNMDQTRLYERPTNPTTVDFLSETRKFPVGQYPQHADQYHSVTNPMQSDANFYQEVPGIVGWDQSRAQLGQSGSQSARGQYSQHETDDQRIVDDYVVYGDASKKHKITVPSPLQYELRMRNQPETAKQRKFKEYVDQKRQEDQDALMFKFRAKSVPKAVREPLYDKIMSVSLYLILGTRTPESRG